jgi:CRISPR associated protein Cas1
MPTKAIHLKRPYFCTRDLTAFLIYPGKSIPRCGGARLNLAVISYQGTCAKHGATVLNIMSLLPRGHSAIEAQCGGAYWRRWRGQELTFKGDHPPEWDVFKTRPRSWRTGRLGENGRQFSNRFALHPVNAMLNFGGSIIVAQCARALAGLGLDPAFGVLHSARPGMHALAWDAFALLRVRLEEAVFGFIRGRTFQASEFKIVQEPKPHLMFAPPLGRELAAHVLRRVPFKEVVKACQAVAALF